MDAPTFIGGFFSRAEPMQDCALSVAQAWALPEQPEQGFFCARAALAALLAYLAPNRLWLPAYLCPSLIEAATGHRINFFSVDELLEPDFTKLAPALQSGDVVLAINYFGRAPCQAFRQLVKNHPDVLFIEDCAQALDTGRPVWGHWRLFSPRKLIGVAEGGYVVAGQGLSPRWNTQPADKAFYQLLEQAPLLRQQQPQANQLWHPLNQQREAAMSTAPWQITLNSHQLLWRLDHASIARQRRQNFTILATALANHSFLRVTEPDFAPLGFPLRLRPTKRSHVREALIDAGIFPAIHWNDLPSPSSLFPVAHQLAQELLTLPCDQRYTTTDMERIALFVTKELDAA